MWTSRNAGRLHRMAADPSAHLAGSGVGPDLDFHPAWPAHLVALRERQPAGQRSGKDGLDQRPELTRRAPRHWILEDPVAGEEATDRGVDPRLRIQGVNDVPCDTQRPRELLQRGAVRPAARERVAVA